MLKFRGGRWFLGDETITPQQASIILFLAINHYAEVNELIELLWPDPDDEGEDVYNHIRVLISMLRPKLRKVGYDIVPNWKRAYNFMEIERAEQIRGASRLQNKRKHSGTNGCNKEIRPHPFNNGSSRAEGDAKLCHSN